MASNNPEWGDKLLELIKLNPGWSPATLAERLNITPKQVSQFKYNHKEEIEANAAEREKEIKQLTIKAATATPESVERQLQDAKDALNREILKGKDLTLELKEVSAKHMAKAEAVEQLKRENDELRQANDKLHGLCDESKRIINQNVAQLKVDKIDIDSLREQNEQLRAQIVELKNSPRQIVSDPELKQQYEATLKELEELNRSNIDSLQSLKDAQTEIAELRAKNLQFEKIAEKYKEIMVHLGEKYASEVLGLLR